MIDDSHFTISNWSDDLCWCPSICSIIVKCDDEFFKAYIRWRHSDPWTGYIIGITNKRSSSDLLDTFGYYFTEDDSLNLIKSEFLSLALRWFRDVMLVEQAILKMTESIQKNIKIQKEEK